MAQPDDRPHRDYEHRVSTTEAERIAIAASKLATNDALNEVFASFGIARGNVESLEKFRQDLLFLRQLRQRPDIWPDFDFLAAMRSGSVKAASRVLMTVLTLATSALLYGIWSLIKGK